MSDQPGVFELELGDLRAELRALSVRLDRVGAQLDEVRVMLDSVKRKPYRTPTLTVGARRPAPGDPDFRCDRCDTECVHPVPGRNREGFKWMMCLCGLHWVEMRKGASAAPEDL